MLVRNSKALTGLLLMLAHDPAAQARRGAYPRLFLAGFRMPSEELIICCSDFSRSKMAMTQPSAPQGNMRDIQRPPLVAPLRYS
jgi:hypothetical protein